MIGAIPKYFARIHPRYLTPSASTIWMGALSIIWYAGLTVVSQNILYDSIAALGLMIAFYYGLSGLACVWFFRRSMKTAKGWLLAGVAPLVVLVVVGTVGASPISGALLGSVVLNLVQRSSIPLLVVPTSGG